MAEHPGPWVCHVHGDRAACIKTVDGEHVGYAYGPEDGRKAAAAPEMLEALEMVAKYDRGNWMDRPWSRAVAKAIAKAKGQE